MVLMDPIVYQVILSRLTGIVQEMTDAVFRTGYSTIIRESHDASCMLVDADGNAVSEYVSSPLHVPCVAAIVRSVRRDFGDDIAPGDAFITNHPYAAGLPHSMDMAAITPIFSGGELVAFGVSIAHKSDLGGVVPGTSYGLARELFQEGIQYPPVRLMRGGELVRDVEAILRANSRTPDLILGDLRGQIGSTRLGERRLHEVIARYGLADVLATFRRKLEVTEQRARAAIREWPDGAHEAEAFVDNDGIDPNRRVRFHARVEKRGDRIRFDFSDSDDQAPGAINLGPALTRACVHYALIATIDKLLPNDGGLEPVCEITTRRGSIVDPHFPAPRSAYSPSTNAVSLLVLEALSRFVPSRTMAANGGSGGISIAGRRPDGSEFNQYELPASAWGAIVGKDGPSGITVLHLNTNAASIEILESEFPTRLRRFELIQDCGGPGEFRGGLSQRRVYEILTDDAQLGLRGGIHAEGPKGALGGRPGRVGCCLIDPGTSRERALPSRFAGVRLRCGDVVQLDKAGGGGLGNPRERPFEAVLADVLDGYVSRAAALAEYGLDAQRLDNELARWGAGELVAK